jgi:2-polyprenyl-3-methyl-5-hydroxy-6-metoxy-1,4-benzoquinol methylase
MIDGGYDDGYRNCDCFWGDKPGSLVSKFFEIVSDVSGKSVLDAGCGEGKNSRAFSSKGALVTAVDCSEAAITNGRKLWGDAPIKWSVADIRSCNWPPESFDVVIAYGLFHCLPDEQEVRRLLETLQRATKIDGYNIICTFNDRSHDLSAHPGFSPCLLPHDWYEELYADWQILLCSDEDLFETHPHNAIPHQHSLTRLLVRREK